MTDAMRPARVRRLPPDSGGLRMPGRNAKRHAAATIAFTTAIAIALGAATAPDAEALGSRGRLLKMINNVRDRHDLRELRIDRSLSRDAVRHTRRMVEANDVF